MSDQIPQNLKDGTVLLEPREDFDPCIIGYCDEKGRLEYSYEKVVEMFMSREGWSIDEAVEWVDYNTVRACRYIENSPAILMWNEETEELEDITQ